MATLAAKYDWQTANLLIRRDAVFDDKGKQEREEGTEGRNGRYRNSVCVAAAPLRGQERMDN